jgi:hypothetical protein
MKCRKAAGRLLAAAAAMRAAISTMDVLRR